MITPDELLADLQDSKTDLARVVEAGSRPPRPGPLHRRTLRSGEGMGTTGAASLGQGIRVACRAKRCHGPGLMTMNGQEISQ